MLARIGFAALMVVVLGSCGTVQVGEDIAQVCRHRLNNAKGSGMRPQCNAYWRQYQTDAYLRGGQPALDAAHAEALSYGNVARPLPN